jgi:hypothetical protein
MNGWSVDRLAAESRPRFGRASWRIRQLARFSILQVNR